MQDDKSSNLKQNILRIIIVETFWLLCTLVTDPVYPFLKNSDGSLNKLRLLMMTTLFGTISIGFETAVYNMKKKKHE